MTDPNHLDELASAHLDGATSREEAALIEADPALQARVEELRAVRAALAEVPQVDPKLRDSAIAAALAAFHDDGAQSEPVAPVVPLSPRRGVSPRVLQVVGAAAVVAVLALLVPLLAGTDDGEDEASLESTEDVIEGAADTTTTTPSDQEVAEDSIAAQTRGQADEADLGTYPDLDALADAVPRQVDPGDFSSERQQNLDAGPACAPPAPTGTRLGSATVAGEPVVVWLRLTPDGPAVLSVLRTDGCVLIDRREL